MSFKYDRAVEYFNKGDFVKAEMLFDELYAVLRSTDKAENVSYYLSYCKLKLGDYGMASYLLKIILNHSQPVLEQQNACT